MKEKHSTLKLLLTVLFVSCLIISNVAINKQIDLFRGLTITGGIAFPITYIISDIFSEVYGYKRSRITSRIAFFCNLLLAVIIRIVIQLPAPDYRGNQEAFELILGNSWRIVLASGIAYVVGDFVNDRIFRKMKGDKGDKGFKIRALVSSIGGELFDSATFIFIAFVGILPIGALFATSLGEVLVKISVEALLLPLTHYAVRKIKRYEDNLLLEKK